jgi:hypothetical protein
MWLKKPVDWWQQRLARQRYMPRTRQRSAATTAKFAIAALVLILGAATLLELRRGGGSEAELIEHARASRQDPLDLVEAAGRVRRLIMITDIPSATAPRRFAADAIERLAMGPGLDIVALDIDVDEQPFIERYLATTPEDASILLARPRAVREHDGASRALLDVYRTVWRVNQELGAARRVRIVALDRQGWPPARATAPSAAAVLFAERGDHMMETIHARVLNRSPNARVLFLVDGLHALKSGSGRVQTGGARPAEVEWLGAQLARRYPQDVFTILVDATPGRVIAPDVAAYRGTALADALRRGGLGSGFALRAAEPLNALTRTPIRVIGTTGLDFQLEPRASPFTDLADAYVYFGG